MSDPKFSQQEQELIERLANAPQPSLNPAAFDMIRGRILDAMDNPPLDVSPRMLRPSTPLPLSYLTAIAAVLVIGIGVGILVANLSRQPETATPIIATEIPFTAPSATPVAPTITPIVPTQTPQLQVPPGATVQQTIPSTVAPTATLPGATNTPAPQVTHTTATQATVIIPATATLEAVIVIEGPVEAIVANVVTIYGIEIALNPDDPLLTVIQVGDVLHVEADYATEETQIVAVTAEPVEDEVAVNPETGDVWRDDGSCSNPPPPWAPANGWRRRCEGASGNNSPSGQGQGHGQGNSNAGGNGNGQGQGNNNAGGNGNGQGQGNGQGRGNNDDDD